MSTLPPLQRIEPVQHRLIAAAGVAAFAAGSGVVGYFNPGTSNFFPLCPLHALTGLACPGCGLTRAFHALFTGDLIGALDFNLLVPIWALIFAYVAISLTLTAVRGRGLPMWPTHPRFLIIFFVVLLVFGVLRNIPVWPLTILYP